MPAATRRLTILSTEEIATLYEWAHCTTLSHQFKRNLWHLFVG